MLFALSFALLVASLGPFLALSGRQPKWLLRTVPHAYIVSATLLTLSQADSHSGLSIVLLVPVISVAIRATKLDSAATVASMLASLLVISVLHHTGVVVLVRVLILWAALGVVLSVAIHGLRDRVAAHEAKLVIQARTDPLTGLSNRREFDEAVRLRRGRRPFVMLSIDVEVT